MIPRLKIHNILCRNRVGVGICKKINNKSSKTFNVILIVLKIFTKYYAFSIARNGRNIGTYIYESLCEQFYFCCA